MDGGSAEREIRGWVGVYARRLSGLENKLAYGLKLVVDMLMDGIMECVLNG